MANGTFVEHENCKPKVHAKPARNYSANLQSEFWSFQNKQFLQGSLTSDINSLDYVVILR